MIEPNGRRTLLVAGITLALTATDPRIVAASRARYLAPGGADNAGTPTFRSR
ncbi:hypothetical protein WEI85_24500 [Actinomycetes bacterium KLBMP 9797]